MRIPAGAPVQLRRTRAVGRVRGGPRAGGPRLRRGEDLPDRGRGQERAAGDRPEHLRPLDAERHRQPRDHRGRDGQGR